MTDALHSIRSLLCSSRYFSVRLLFGHTPYIWASCSKFDSAKLFSKELQSQVKNKQRFFLFYEIHLFENAWFEVNWRNSMVKQIRLCGRCRNNRVYLSKNVIAAEEKICAS